MELRSILIVNGVGILLLLILRYASRAKIQRHHIEDRVYSFMVVGVMLGCFMEALSYAIDGQLFTGSRLLNYLANTYLYTFNILLPLGLLAYVDIGLFGNPDRIWKKYWLQFAIGAFMLAATVVNFFVPISYVITDANVYERRPFSYAYYLVILFFCITAIIVTKRFERDNGAKSFFNVMVFLVPILIGAGLQFVFYGLSLAWLSAALGLTGMFMMQQNELAYIDSLVDTYNRQYLDHVLSAWVGREKNFAGAMFDVDGFKAINDNYGHSEGDKALIAVTDLLKQARTDGERVFRFAGDEFIVLKLADSADELSPYLDKVEELVQGLDQSDRPYQIRLSYGVGFFDGSTVDAFLKEMDDNMYAMKARHYAEAEDMSA